MKRTFALVLLVLVGKTGVAQQAEPRCAPGSGTSNSPDYVTSDACQKAVDLFKYMFPQLGALITTGNAASSGGSTGGLGHARLELRTNTLVGSVPVTLDAAPQPGPYHSDRYGTSTQTMVVLGATAEVGVFRGLPVGATHIGGIDALLTATHIFDVTSYQAQLDRVTVRSSEMNLEWSVGARLALLEETPLTPGVSITYASHRLPTSRVAGTVVTGSDNWSTLAVDNMHETTNGWRLVAGKTLTRLRVDVGAGRDRYRAKGDVNTTVNFGFAGGTRSPTPMDESLDRTTYFVHGSTNGSPFRFTGELGLVAGGRVATYNTFSKPADAARPYGSIGVRFDVPGVVSSR